MTLLDLLSSRRFGHSKKRRRKQSRELIRDRRLAMEPLEERRLLSASAQSGDPLSEFQTENNFNSVSASNSLSPPQHVVQIIIDGQRPDVLRDYLAGPGIGGALSSILLGGIDLVGAVTVFPSYTFAAQASLITGVHPGTHGITGNEYFDRASETTRVFDAEAVLDLKSVLGAYGYEFGLGVSCEGTIHPANSPVDQGLANLDLQVQTIYEAAPEGIDSLVSHHMYWRGADHPLRPEAADLCDYRDDLSAEYDTAMIDKVVEFLAGNPAPELMTLYFAGLDHESHLEGEVAPADSSPNTQLDFLQNTIDPQLSRIISALDNQGVLDQTVFVITADHGHQNVIEDDAHAVELETQFDQNGMNELDRELEQVVEDAIVNGVSYDVFDNVFESSFNAFVGLNGGMASISLQNRETGEWSDLPRLDEDIWPVVESIQKHRADDGFLDFETELFEAGIDAIDEVLVRVNGNYQVYQQDPISGLSGNPWHEGFLYPINAIASLRPDYLDPLTRINEYHHSDRSGDIVLLSNFQEGFYFSGEQASTHGSLYPEDSSIPFMIGGQPIRDGVVVADNSDFPHVLSAIDVAPTVASILGFEIPGAQGRSRIVFASPVADPGDPYEVSEGGSVELDGSASQIFVGSDVVFKWDLDGDGDFGETGTAAVRGDELGVNPIFQPHHSDDGLPDGATQIPVSLLLNVDGLDTPAVTTHVTLHNTPPFAEISGPAFVSANQEVTYTATVTDPSLPDQANFNYPSFAWSANVNGTTYTGFGTSFTFTPTSNVQFDLNYEVSDDDGGTRMVTKVINLVSDGPAPLDTRIDGQIAVADDIDVYHFTGMAGRELSITAYWGDDNNNAHLGDGGRLRLLGPDGTVLGPPVEVSNQTHLSSLLHNYILPEDGTYFVEVLHTNHGTGDYWLGITNPLENFVDLPLTGATTDAFGAQGDWQEYEFTVTAGQAVAWTIQADRSLENWAIYDPNDNFITGASEGLGSFETFAFTATIEGVHRLVFEDVKSASIASVGQFGPFAYTLNAADDAPLNQPIPGHISVANEVDLYSLIGMAGRELSITAYWGDDNNNAHLGDGGRLRLLGPDGTVLGPPVEVSNQTHLSSLLHNYILPEDGTYFVEVLHTNHGTGDYWLGITNPLENFVDLPLTGATTDAFGAQGDWQEYEFTVTAGQAVAWTIQADRSLENWAIYDPNDNFITGASEGLGSFETFAFTATIEGVHRLVFEDVKSASIASVGQFGPFAYTLNAADDAPLNQPIPGHISVANEVDLYSLIGMAGRELSITAYWGDDNNNAHLGDGGRLRLLGPDGTVLGPPVEVSNQTHLSSLLHNYILPEDGTYFVEVLHTNHGTGDYWLGITNPLENFVDLPLTGATTDAFGAQGDWQEYEFTVTAGQAVAWTIQADRSLENWAIYDPNDNFITGASEGLGSFETFAFTATIEGVHRLVFEDVKSASIASVGQFGPFAYTLNAADDAPLNQPIPGDISVANEVDLYSFTGVADREVSITAYWGNNSGSQLVDRGRVRLIGPDGTVLETPQQIEFGGHYSSLLYDYELPEDGTYFVEVLDTSHGTGNYWLSITDPHENFVNLPLTGVTTSEFGTQRDLQEYEFTVTAGQAVAWTFQGDRSLDDWAIYDPNGQQVVGGVVLDSFETFAFTATTSGVHRLIFQTAKSNAIASVGQFGPFAYTLNAGDDDGDGSSSNVENGAPNLGDGNDDGILDRDQVNVTSFPTTDSQNYLTVVTSDTASLENVSAAVNPSPFNSPSQFTFLDGFVDFEINGVPTGNAETLDIILHSGNFAVGYYKFGPTPDNTDPHWYSFVFDGTTGAEILSDRIVLHFVDGQRGDDDLTANGVIVDVGGPVFESIPGDFDGSNTVDGNDLTNWESGFGIQSSANRSDGDADRDGDVDGADFLSWQRNFNKSVSAPPTPGDFQLDGDVDGADFLAWQRGFGKNGDATPGDGDVDGDRDVDGDDLTAWQNNFSANSVSAASSSQILTVASEASSPATIELPSIVFSELVISQEQMEIDQVGLRTPQPFWFGPVAFAIADSTRDHRPVVRNAFVDDVLESIDSDLELLSDRQNGNQNSGSNTVMEVRPLSDQVVKRDIASSTDSVFESIGLYDDRMWQMLSNCQLLCSE